MQMVGGRKRKRSRSYAAPRKGARFAPRRRRRPNSRTAGFLGIETKFYDTSLVGSTLTGPTDASGGEHNPSATIALNTVVQGDGEQNRDGRKMVMKSIYVSGVVRSLPLANHTVVEPNHIIVISLVLDTQTNGALLSSENVFTNPSGNQLTVTQHFRNLQYIQRFKVLKTIKLVLDNQVTQYDGTNIEVGQRVTPFSMFAKLSDIPVNFTGTSENIANIVDNSLHVVAYVYEAGSGSATLTYNARLRFVG